MLLDVDAATLTVSVNGVPQGVMVRPGMTMSSDGDPVHRLEGSLYWTVRLSGASVAIGGGGLII